LIGDKVLGVRNLLNVVLDVDLAALDDILALLHLEVWTFKTKHLSALLESIVQQDIVQECVQEMVWAAIAFPM
jgi:hypothetical protein